MRHSRRNGLIAAVVAGGGLAVAGVSGFAYADADASGLAEGSPGVLSGNLVQVPVHVPVNVCGNTVSVVGVLNAAAGNRCVNTGRGADAGSPSQSGGASAGGHVTDSPGVVSGNGVQVPVHVPVNVSGNSVNVVGVGNSSSDNSSTNGDTPTGGNPVQPPVVDQPPTPPAPPAPPVVDQPVTPPAPPAPPAAPAPSNHTGALAHTGADATGYLLPAGGALLLGGVLLYRRFRIN